MHTARRYCDRRVCYILESMKRVIATACGAALVIFSFGIAHAQTIDELKALIQTLTQQITVLEQQIAAKKAGQGVVGSAACPNLYRALSVGVSGADVTALQTFLAADATVYPEGLITSYFGPATERAVQRWQAKNGVVSSGTAATTGYGMVGPGTRAAIARVCSTTTPPPITTPPPPTVTLKSCNFGSTTMKSGETRTLYLTGTVAFGATCQGAVRTCIDGVLGGDATYGFLSCTPPTTGRSCLLADGTSIGHGNTPTLYKQSTVLFGQNCAAFSQVRTCNDGALSGNFEYQYTNCTAQGAGACIVVASSTASTPVAHSAQRDFYQVERVVYDQLCNNYKQTRVCTDGYLSGNVTYKYPSCQVTPAKTCTLDNVTIAHTAKYTFYSARSVASGASCSSLGQERTCTDGTLSGTATNQYSVCAPTGTRWCLLDGKYTGHNTSGTYYSQKTVPFGNSCSQFSQTRLCTDGTLAGSSSYQYASCSASTAAACTLDGKTVDHGASAAFYSVTAPPTGETCEAYQQIRYCNDGFLSGSASFSQQSCS